MDEHLLERLDVDVEECARRGYGGAGHVAAGGVEQCVDTAIAGHDLVAVALHDSGVHDVGDEEHGLASLGLDFGHQLVALLLAATHQHHLGAFGCQILAYACAEHTGTAGDDHDFVLD